MPTDKLLLVGVRVPYPDDGKDANDHLRVSLTLQKMWINYKKDKRESIIKRQKIKAHIHSYSKI